MKYLSHLLTIEVVIYNVYYQLGWVEEVERKTTKKVTKSKEVVTNKVSDLLDTSSPASSSVTGSLSSSMPKRKTDQESNNSTQVPAYKAVRVVVLR